MNIIDAHCHYDRTKEKELIKAMIECGIDKAVICPSEAYITVANREGNKRTAKLAQKYPERFIGFAVANPWYKKKALEILKEAHEMGLRGLKFNSSLQGFFMHDPIVFPLVEKAIEYNWPMYWHTGTPIYSLPFQLAHLSRRYPEGKFIMGHSGFADVWTDVVAVAKLYSNIFMETSLFLITPVLKQALNELGSERLIFGSDFPTGDIYIQLKKMTSWLPLEHKENVLGKNILRLIYRNKLK